MLCWPYPPYKLLVLNFKIIHHHKNSCFVLCKYFDFQTNDTDKEDTETADSFHQAYKMSHFVKKSFILTMKDENMV